MTFRKVLESYTVIWGPEEELQVVLSAKDLWHVLWSSKYNITPWPWPLYDWEGVLSKIWRLSSFIMRPSLFFIQNPKFFIDIKMWNQIVFKSVRQKRLYLLLLDAVTTEVNHQRSRSDFWENVELACNKQFACQKSGKPEQNFMWAQKQNHFVSFYYSNRWSKQASEPIEGCIEANEKLSV